jgi:hypothetical protein
MIADEPEELADTRKSRLARAGLQAIDFGEFAIAQRVERTPVGARMVSYENPTRPTSQRYVARDQLLREIRSAGKDGLTKMDMISRIVGVARSTIDQYISYFMTRNVVIRDQETKRYRLLLA